MTYKIFARKDRISAKGVRLVFLLQPGDIRVSPGIYCKPGSWDQRTQSVRMTGAQRDPSAGVINVKIKKATIKLQELINSGASVESIREAFKSPEPEQPTAVVHVNPISDDYYDSLTDRGKRFYHVIETIINSHKSRWSEDYNIRFRTVRNKILDFDADFTIEKLNETWWTSFVNYCIDTRGNTSNTIYADRGIIAAIMKIAGKPGHGKLDWEYVEPEIKALSWDQVKKIQSLDLSEHPTPTIRDSRTLWMAAALTGRRWREVANMGPSNFYQRGGWRYKNMGKGNKMIDIPLLDEAVAFFKKIKFGLPKLAPQTVNQDIKTICRIAGFKDLVLVITPISPGRVTRKDIPEWKTVHFHTARHSYAHRIIELSEGIPHKEKFVSFMLGHASFQTTWRYLNRYASSNEEIFKQINLGGR